MKLKISLDQVSKGKVTLDDFDISSSLYEISFKAAAGELLDVTLRLLCEVDADIDARLDKIEMDRKSLVFPCEHADMNGDVKKYGPAQ